MVFTVSVFGVKGYRSIGGDSFLSFNKDRFETQLFFWLDGLGENHVRSQICVLVLRRLGVSKEDRDALIRKGEFYRYVEFFGAIN